MEAMEAILDLIVCTTEGNSFGMTCTSFYVGSSISIAFGILHLFVECQRRVEYFWDSELETEGVYLLNFFSQSRWVSRDRTSKVISC